MDPEKIVLIEDNAHFLLFLSQRLEDEGYVVNAFECLEDAMPHIGNPENAFSLILLDYLDGETAVSRKALQEIKNRRPGSRIVIMSACDDKERARIDKLINGGLADGFLQKPPDLRRIREFLHRC